MAKSSITVSVTLPWWAVPYIRFCSFFAAIHGLEPNAEKIGATVAKHIRLKVA